MLVYLGQQLDMEMKGSHRFPGNPCAHALIFDLGQV